MKVSASWGLSKKSMYKTYRSAGTLQMFNTICYCCITSTWVNSQISKNSSGKWLRKRGCPSPGCLIHLVAPQITSTFLPANVKVGLGQRCFNHALSMRTTRGWRGRAALIYTTLSFQVRHHVKTRLLWLKQTWQPLDRVVTQSATSYYILLFNENNEKT